MFRNGMIAFMAVSIALIAVIGGMMVRFPHPNLSRLALARSRAHIVPIYPLFAGTTAAAAFSRRVLSAA
jgi:hypothetical protein